LRRAEFQHGGGTAVKNAANRERKIVFPPSQHAEIFVGAVEVTFVPFSSLSIRSFFS